MKRAKYPQDLPTCLQNYTDLYSVYRSDNVRALVELREFEGFSWLAWTTNVRYLLYSKKRNILLEDVEGDIYFEENPTEETIEEYVQQYPKAEVSIGEKYDSRFDRR